VIRQALPSVNIDVYEEKDEIVAKAELPGIKKENIKVNISDHILMIKGRKEERGREETRGLSRFRVLLWSICAEHTASGRGAD
jgi:HSP20 family protein